MTKAVDIRSVELGQGISVTRFRHPSSPEGERWRVVMPRWARGTWLDGNYWFPTLQDALDALTETGTLEAAEAWWDAKMVESSARQAFFTKSMSAYVKAQKK